MRSRFVQNSGYTYSVKYNYVGGKIYANDVEVGSVKDVNIPVIFTHKDPSVRIRFVGAPSSKSEEKVVGSTTEWGDAVGVAYSNWYTTLEIGCSKYNDTRYMVKYRIIPASSGPVKRKQNKYDIVRVTTTTYNVPPEQEVGYGESQFEYVENYSYHDQKKLISQETVYYELNNSDIVPYEIGVDMRVDILGDDDRFTPGDRTLDISGNSKFSSLNSWRIYYVDISGGKLFSVEVQHPSGGVTVFNDYVAFGRTSIVKI